MVGVLTGQAFNAVTQSTIGTSGSPAVVNLGSLAYNGGRTPTHRLLSSSPEIAKDKGSAVSPALTTDNRGAARVVDDGTIPNATGGNGSDIGAYEVGNTTWIGASSSVFDNSLNGNWAETAAPSAGTNVFVLDGVVTNEPSISTNTTVNNLLLGIGRTLTVNTGNTLTVNGSFTLNGMIKGNGAIATSSLVNNGVIAPGNSPGLLTLNGNFDNSTGTLQMGLGGATTAGIDYDQLAVTGAATLNGTVNVSLINGFTPTVGSQFTIMTYASKSGTFNTVSLPNIAPLVWNVVYNANSVVLKVTSFPLPVRLVSFSGKKANGGNEISWKTASENHLKNYVVEWSGDNQNWQSIYVAVAKNKQEENNYLFLHQIVSEEDFYRLRAVDEDGKFTVSQTIKLASESRNGVKLYPNPALNNLTLSLTSSEEAIVQFISEGGQIVVQKKMNAALATVDISSLHPGAYWVCIKQAQKTSVARLIKQ